MNVIGKGEWHVFMYVCYYSVRKREDEGMPNENTKYANKRKWNIESSRAGGGRSKKIKPKINKMTGDEGRKKPR